MPATQQLKQEQVRSVLASLNIEFSEPNDALFRFTLEPNLVDTALIRVREQSVVLYALSEIRIPKPYRLKVAEYIVRVNFALNFGNFEVLLVWLIISQMCSKVE